MQNISASIPHPVTQGIHHVAYRCKDAKETVEWYQKHFCLLYTSDAADDTR
jgi:catechol 2,3-dioxygenase-like lactoylglutathione lyase family enzyme